MATSISSAWLLIVTSQARLSSKAKLCNITQRTHSSCCETCQAGLPRLIHIDVLHRVSAQGPLLILLLQLRHQGRPLFNGHSPPSWDGLAHMFFQLQCYFPVNTQALTLWWWICNVHPKHEQICRRHIMGKYSTPVTRPNKHPLDSVNSAYLRSH